MNENAVRVNAHIRQLMTGGFRRSADDLNNPFPFAAVAGEVATAALTPIAARIGDKIGRTLTGEDEDKR